MRYVIAYDIADDGRRTRLAHLLEAYGDRVQYSVFECDLDHGQLAHAIACVEEFVWPGADRVRVYRLCAACAGEIESIGTSSGGLDDDLWIV